MAGKQPKNKADHLKGHKWKKGESGNPSGRPQGALSMVSFLRQALSESDGKRARKIMDAMIEKAEEGDIRHIKEILERIDGKVADEVKNDGKLEIVITRKPYQPSDDDDS